MIAPTKTPETETPKTGRLRRAHRMLAAAFLPERGSQAAEPVPVVRWQAWLFTGWVVLVVGVYLVNMLVG